jgi:predicted PurR-regulated permease PerM
MKAPSPNAPPGRNDREPASPAPAGLGTFVAKVLVVAGIAVVLLLLWRLGNVLVLAFGAIVGAIVMNALVSRIERLGLGRLWATVGSVLLLLVAFALGGWLLGGRLSGEFDHLQQRVPAALEALRAWLAEQPFGNRALSLWSGLDRDSIPWSGAANVAGMTLEGIGNVLLMAIVAIYLTADPRLYRRGLVRLFPPSQRDRVEAGLRASGDGLAGWLLGQGMAMLFVGVATGIGLALLGVPLAFSLGVIAGLLDFVPFFGPIVSGALAVVVAFSVGPTTAFYVALLTLAIQQLEANLVVPLVQRWAVQLPPALGIVSVLVFGMLFGVIGIIFATPLMVVVMILLQHIYVRDLLEKAPSPAPARPR